MFCRACKSTSIAKIIDLGNQPWGNDFLKKNQIGKEKKYPLVLVFCRTCKIVQLNFTVKKEVMFKNHTYLSGVTDSLYEHFSKVGYRLRKDFNCFSKRKSILDIGSNDGTFLKYFKKINWDILGVESAKNISKIANQSKIKTINKFFNENTAKKINKKFDFINASGVFFHLEELDSVTKGIKFLLKDRGVFVVQFLYMKSIVENCAFDQIYHEHLLYYNLKTLNNYLNKFDLEIFDCYLTSTHGGQMIAYVCHKGKFKETNNYLSMITEEDKKKCNTLQYYKQFSNRVKKLIAKNLKFIKNSIKQKKIIYGMGAPVKGNTLLNFFKLNKKQIPVILEINNLRKNTFTPGSHIPVVLEKDNKMIPDIFYVLAWNFKKEILKKKQDLIKKGVKFYFPIEVKKK